MGEPSKARELAGAVTLLVVGMVTINAIALPIVAIFGSEIVSNPVLVLLFLAFGFFGARYATRYIAWPLANRVAGVDR